MHIWLMDGWKEYINIKEPKHRSGLYLRIDKNVNPKVAQFCKQFAKWLRKEFYFPIRVVVYIKSSYRIKARDGDMVIGTFLRPFDYKVEPYARLATGDYQELVEKSGEEQAMWAILRSFSHELTHYFQYINNLPLTLIGEERQATIYSENILYDYDDFLNDVGIHNNKKHIWKLYDWERYLDIDVDGHISGVRYGIGKKIAPEVCQGCKKFIKWLKDEYSFPVRIVIHLKDTQDINTRQGRVKTVFYENEQGKNTSGIYVAVGDYSIMAEERGENEALLELYRRISYEITHYFQWINHLRLTDIGKERQAKRYTSIIINEYLASTLD